MVYMTRTLIVCSEDADWSVSYLVRKGVDLGDRVITPCIRCEDDLFLVKFIRLMTGGDPIKIPLEGTFENMVMKLLREMKGEELYMGINADSLLTAVCLTASYLRMRHLELEVASKSGPRAVPLLPIRGLDNTEKKVMGIVIEKGPLSLLKLAEILERTPPSVLKVVSRLESLNLISKVRTGKEVEIRPTASGRLMFEVSKNGI